MAQFVSVSYMNEVVKLRYWPNADGQRYDGYVTNLKQIFEQLRRKGLKNKFNLYAAQHKPILSQRHFKEELHKVPTGGTLQLFAVERNHVTPRAKMQVKRNIEKTLKVVQHQKLVSATRLNSECCHCVQHPIVGRSYANVRSKNTSYFLCSTCYSRLQAADKRNWQLVRKVVSPSPHRATPQSLARQHSRPAIAFLPVLNQAKKYHLG